MTTLLTDAGLIWLGQILAGTTPTNSFTGLELGQGNDIPAGSNTRANLNAKIGASLVNVSAGYPILGDSDLRNDGRGVSTYTWKWVYPEGSLQILASNAIVTNYAAGAPIASEPVMVSSSTVLTKRVDQELTVFVNVTQAGAASLTGYLDDGQPLVEQLATWRQQSIMLSGAPGSSPVTNGVAQSRLTEGEQVWTGARLLDGSGAVLTRPGVMSVLLTVLQRSRERDWQKAYEVPLPVEDVMTTAPVRTDPRWRGTQGYTFAHAWIPDGTWGARRTRLEYALILTNGKQRTLVHEVEWASVRTR